MFDGGGFGADDAAWSYAVEGEGVAAYLDEVVAADEVAHGVDVADDDVGGGEYEDVVVVYVAFGLGEFEGFGARVVDVVFAFLYVVEIGLGGYGVCIIWCVSLSLLVFLANDA